MTKYELTDKMIRQSFNNIGVEEKFYPIYEAEIKRCFHELQTDCPDDEDTTEEESNAYSSIDLTNDYIKYYVEEAEKGQCPKWCASVATNSVTGGEDYWIYRVAYDCLESEEERKRELEIHTNSLSDDPIFRDRYISMFKECITNLKENTEEYTRIYHSLISKGKSEIYSRAYADIAAEYDPFFCEIYADAYELASEHGMDSSDAYSFGDFCTEAVDQGLWVYINQFVERYHEQWQKEFYLRLICDEIRRTEKKDINASLLSDLKKDLRL